MIVARAPLRVSLAGGGSDLPGFYRQEFGEVLSFAINKYVYLAGHEYFAGGMRLSYSKTETVNNVEDIEHPLFRNSMKYLSFSGDIELSSFADVPGSGTGLGSSSAFTVALVHLLSTFKGISLSSQELAKIACEIEIELCGEPIGKQDQYASAFGGMNRFRFNSDESVDCSNWDLGGHVSFLNETLLLYHTGIGRSASSILKEQTTRLDTEPDAIQRIRKIRDRVDEMASCVLQEDSKGIGRLLSESWLDKQQLATGISNNRIDGLLERAISCGASGGKLVGAGGGGFLLLCVDPQNRKTFQEKFTDLRHLPFLLDTVGSRIVYNDEVN